MTAFNKEAAPKLLPPTLLWPSQLCLWAARSSEYRAEHRAVPAMGWAAQTALLLFKPVSAQTWEGKPAIKAAQSQTCAALGNSLYLSLSP